MVYGQLGLENLKFISIFVNCIVIKHLSFSVMKAAFSSYP